MKNLLIAMLVIYPLCALPSTAQNSGSGFDIPGLGGLSVQQQPIVTGGVSTTVAPTIVPTIITPVFVPGQPITQTQAQTQADAQAAAQAAAQAQIAAQEQAAQAQAAAQAAAQAQGVALEQAAAQAQMNQALMQQQAQQYMSNPANITGLGVGLPTGLPYTSTSGLIINTVNCPTCRENGNVDTTLLGGGTPTTSPTYVVLPQQPLPQTGSNVNPYMISPASTPVSPPGVPAGAIEF